MLEIAEIRIYPVKGLRGISLDQAVVEPWGLEHDRRWMVIDAQGKFVTQRQIPAMAVVGAELLPDGLRLTAPGRDPLGIAIPGADAETLAVIVWDDDVAARAAGPGADRWISQALGTACRLVHMSDPALARPVDPDFADASDRVSFADGFPLLVTNVASLDDLNGRLPRRASMDRFRSNLVVRGAEPWDEDAWRHLRVGAIQFDAVKDCARCAVPTVDQETGVKDEDAEPMRTLARFRRKAQGRIIFGQNLIPRGVGTLRVGDPVHPSP